MAGGGRIQRGSFGSSRRASGNAARGRASHACGAGWVDSSGRRG